MSAGLIPLAPLISRYSAALATAPLLTNSVTAAGLSLVSDGVAQKLEGGDYNIERAAWQFVWGGAIAGAMLYYWFALLQYLFPRARESVLALIGKVFVNQVVMSPGLNGGFFAFVIFTRTPPKLRMPLAKREAVKAKWRQDLLPTVIRSCLFWSCAQTINFGVLPPRLVTFSTNIFFLIWTTYLCVVGNRKVKST